MAPLELMVLQTLDAGPNHGFGITLHIETVSGGLLGVEEGSLYPALHRLEKEGALTAAGRKRLARAREEWAGTAKGLNRLLRYA